MASASVFSPAFKYTLVSKSLPCSSSRSSKKRKRGNDGLESQTGEKSSEVWKTAGESDSISSSSNFHSSAAKYFTPNGQDMDQFYVAGQSLNRSLLGHNFPHTAATMKTKILPEPSDQFEDELAMLKPPLSVPGRLCWGGPSKSSSSSGEGFRRRHVAALTTVLHRCISEGDFLRAGRAWAILIRFRMNGHSLDIRNDDRWGIGADILCQRSTLLGNESTENVISMPRKVDGNDNCGQIENMSKFRPLHKQGSFQEAQDYYERLTLQYPYHKVFSNAVSALDFCPTSYALRIWSLHDQYERPSKSPLTESTHLKPNNNLDEMASPNEGNTLANPNLSSVSFRHRNEIAERLDELLSSPPHSDDPRLWSIRGMVALWIGDLSITHSPQEVGIGSVQENEQMTNKDYDVTREGAGENPGKSNSNDNFQKRHLAIEKANKAFEKASRLRNYILADIDP